MYFLKPIIGTLYFYSFSDITINHLIAEQLFKEMVISQY